MGLERGRGRQRGKAKAKGGGEKRRVAVDHTNLWIRLSSPHRNMGPDRMRKITKNQLKQKNNN
jgi:hypothetical protein